MSRKAQVVLTDSQYELVEHYSREEHKPVSSLLREALEQSLLKELEERRKDEALKWLFSQNLPVDDWEVMEKQLESRYDCGMDPDWKP